jgi:hypothetical protein
MIISDLLCDLYDIKKMAAYYGFDLKPKDNEGSQTTIGDCLDNVIEQLEEEEEEAERARYAGINPSGESYS